MKMQDKELDELFRSNLDDLELKPSPSVWAGIDAELEKGRRKKVYVPFLSVAASIIVLFTIGYLFIPKKIRVGVETHQQAGLVKTPSSGGRSASTHTVEKAYPTETKHQNIANYADNGSSTAHSAESGDSTKNPRVAVERNDEQLIASINTNKTDVFTPVLPDENVQITNIQPIQIKKPQTVEPQQTIAQVPAITDKRPTTKPKHATLSLGNLINAMVAKVDKRQDKIIEFTDDDGDSNITGVNLGIIKLKKDQQTSEK